MILGTRNWKVMRLMHATLRCWIYFMSTYVIENLLNIKYVIPKLTPLCNLFSYLSSFLHIFQTNARIWHQNSFSPCISKTLSFHVSMARLVGGKYKIGEKIGSGSFGEIHIGRKSFRYYLFLWNKFFFFISNDFWKFSNLI